MNNTHSNNIISGPRSTSINQLTSSSSCIPISSTSNMAYYPIVVDCMVEVLPRTWPGMNKAGGVARVTKCYYENSLNNANGITNGITTNNSNNDTNDENNRNNEERKEDEAVVTHVDVRYVVMGGRERKVPMEYVTPAPQYDKRYQPSLHHTQSTTSSSNGGVPVGQFLNESNGTNSMNATIGNNANNIMNRIRSQLVLRDRSVLLGRCRRCGSLRTDCGSCDWKEELEKNKIATVASTNEQMNSSRNHQLSSSRNQLANKSSKKKYQRTRVTTNNSSDYMPKNNANDDLFDTSSSSSSSSSSESSSSMSDNDFSNPDINTQSFNSEHSNSDDDSDFSSDENDIVTTKLRLLMKRQRQNRSNMKPSTQSSSRLKGRKKARHRRKQRNVNKLSSAYQLCEEQIFKYQKLFDSRRGTTNKKIRNTNTTTTTTTMGGRGGNGAGSVLEDVGLALGGDKGGAKTVGSMTQSSHDSNRTTKATTINERRNDDDSIDLTQTQQSTMTFTMDQSSSENDDDDSTNQMRSTTTPKNHAASSRKNTQQTSPLPTQASTLPHPHHDEINNTQDDTELIQNLVERGPTYAQPEDPEDGQNPLPTVFDSNFIQPEGTDVVNVLPTDMRNMTSGLSVEELPNFFNELCQDLEDEKIPNAETQTKRLAEQVRVTKFDMEGGSRMERLVELEEESLQMFRTFTKTLIRDGTDQCRFALKRMMEEDTRGKKSDLIFLMDSRFDELSDRADLILRSVSHILEDFVYAHDGMENIESDESDTFLSQDLSDDGSDHHSQDTTSNNVQHRDQEMDKVQFGHDCAEERPFDPHMHASRRRKNSDEERYLRKDKSRSNKRARISSLYRSNKKQQHPSKSNNSNSLVANEDFTTHKITQRNGQYSKRSRTHRKYGTGRSRVESSSKRRTIKQASRKTRRNVHDSGDKDSVAQTYTDERMELMDHDGEENTQTEISQSAEPTIMDTFIEDALFESLHNIDQEENEEIPSSIENYMNLSNLRADLDRELRTDPDSAIYRLKKIPDYISSQQLNGSNSHNVAVEVFQSLLSTFQQQGAISLQEMLQTSNKDGIILRINLLICSMKLMQQQLHCQLCESDGIIFQIFQTQGSDCLVENTVLEIIDIIYSQLLPKNWGCPHPIEQTIMDELEILCGSIAKLRHLIELVTSLLLNRFESQKKFRTSPAGIEYVSSIDKSYLQQFWNGSIQRTIGKKKRIDTRLKMLEKDGRKMKRSEIVALWSLLAYFARMPTPAQILPQSETRWKLIPLLFMSKAGVLHLCPIPSNSDKEIFGGILPPCKEQVERCSQEMNNVATLVSVGAYDPLCNSDSMVMKLIHKSVSLDVHHFVHCQDTFRYTAFRHEFTKQDMGDVIDLWIQSDIHRREETIRNDERMSFNESLYTETFGLTDESILNLSPSSDVLSSTTHLISSWISRLPNKKVRWSRFEDSLYSLVENLRNSAKQLEHEEKRDSSMSGTSNVDINDEFNRLFSSSTSSKSHTGTYGYIAYREAAASALISVLIAKIKYITERKCTIPSEHGFKKSICYQIWESVSDEALRENQQRIAKMEPLNQSVTNTNKGSLYGAFISMKIIASLLVYQFDILHYIVSQDEPEMMRLMGSAFGQYDDNLLIFLSSCILSSLFEACKHLNSTTSVDNGVSYMGNQTLAINTPSNSNELSCKNIIAVGLFWLSFTINRAHSSIDKLFSFDHQNCSCIKQALESLSKNIMNMVSPIAKECLATITEAIQLDSSLDACFRLCLSAIRSSIMLTHKQQNSESLFNADGNNSNLSQSLSDRRKEYSEIAGGPIWKFLIQIIESSKPSVRYTIVQHNRRDVDLNLSTSGKKLCVRHGGAVCAVLASLCTLQDPQSVELKAFLQSYTHVPQYSQDHSSWKNDFAYFRYIGQCLSCEICKLAKYSASSRSIVCKNLNEILIQCIDALVDAEPLHLFPSINSDIIQKVGNQSIVEKEKKRMMAMNKNVVTTNHGDPDIDASRIKKQKSEFDDLPGPVYMCKNIWSFCVNLGIVLESISDTQSPVFESIGKALQDSDSELSPSIQKYCQKALKETKSISLERECMKRIMKIRTILDVFMQQNEFIHQFVSAGCSCKVNVYLLVSHLIKALLQGLHSIATGVQYFEGDQVHLAKYAKARALQQAYTHLGVTTFVWCLRQTTLYNRNLGMQTRFIWTYVLQPILKKRGFVISNDMLVAASKQCNLSGIPTIPFDILRTVKVDVSSSRTSSMSVDLFESLSNYFDDLVIYTSSERAQSTQNYELIDTIISLLVDSIQVSDKEATMRLIQKLMCSFVIHERTSSSNSILGGALALYFSITSLSIENLDGVQKSSVSHFRKYSLRHFMLPKLKFDSVSLDLKVAILQIIKGILHEGDSDRRQKCLKISLQEENQSDLELEHDICRMLQSLTLSMQDGLKNMFARHVLITKGFSCARLILKLRVKSLHTSLLTWCRSKDAGNSDTCNQDHICNLASYIVLCMKWINEFARLLSGSQADEFLRLYQDSNILALEGDIPKSLLEWTELERHKNSKEQAIFNDVKSNGRAKNKYQKRDGSLTMKQQSTLQFSASNLESDCLKRAEEFMIEYLGR